MLKDVLTKNLDVVFCGTAKGKVSAALGYYYAGPGNQFYSILHKAGFTPEQLLPSDCYEINRYKVGLTDLVQNQSGNDNEIDDISYDVVGFIERIKKYQPRIIAFNGKKAAAFALGFQDKTNKVAYGLQSLKVGSAVVFVLPSTSGSARKYWDENLWYELMKLIKR